MFVLMQFHFRAEAADGKWMHDSNGYWYKNADGTRSTSKWQQIDGKWYYFEKTGYMATGWKKLGGKTYYLAASGAMVTGWKKIGGDWYYFEKNGAMVTGWLTTGGKRYYLKSDGKMVTGEYTIDGTKYTFDSTGAEVTKKSSTPVSLSSAKIGETVLFGSYMQEKSNTKKTAVEWIVLDQKNGAKLLLSKYALDCVAFNSSGTATWNNSTLRTWLNDSFYKNAFSQTERTKITAFTVAAEKNPNYGTSSGSSTKDKVFCLSMSEAKKYFSGNTIGVSKARACQPTAYAKWRGAWTHTMYTSDWGYGNCWWWLRTAGVTTDSTVFTNYDGRLLDGGIRSTRTNVAVRPAIWVKP